MIGIELTTGQKIQVAVILLVLGVAGYFVFKSTQPGFDTVINSWVEIHKFAANGARITRQAPEDPTLQETHNYFASNDGKVDIVQYLNDPARHPKIVFQPETRITGKTYVYYQDPMAPVAKIKDPFRHALAYATYNQVYDRSLQLLGSTNMTPDQAAKEATARGTMNSEVAFIKTGIDTGTYQSKLMDAVMKALQNYLAKAGDPMKDQAKAGLARKVLEAAAAFESKRLQDTDKYIDDYMDVMEKLLDQTQKDALVAAVAARMSPKTNNGQGRRGAAAGAGGGAATRGGAARGAAGRGGGRGTGPGGAGTGAAGAGRAATAPAGG